MKSPGKHALSALAVTALVGTMLGALAAPAQAAVDNCYPAVISKYNYAQTLCTRGFGRYRVAAKCDSPSYPYTTTIYGPWKSRTSSTTNPPFSKVYGDNYNCHIVKAWTDV
ncbi:hypothetical protein ACTWPT_58355 [Nonomuraea sp. 3N208]|uniref:hypothetical protein n=1 Tax=Nonomuraea sp. 3N208 TaxID=3457421 RepID=UPI003FCEEF50